MILQFGLKKPAFRIVVNTPTTHRLDRADDRARAGDDPRLRRLRRQHHVGQHLAATPAEHQAAGVRGDSSLERAADRAGTGTRVAACRRRRQPRAPTGIAAGPLARRIDEFLASRGYVAPGASPADPVKGENAAPPAAPAEAKAAAPPPRRSRSPWILSARTTFGRRYARVASSSSESGRSLRPRRGTSATSIICSSSPNGRGENRLIFVLPIERIGVSVDHAAAGCYPFLPSKTKGFRSDTHDESCLAADRGSRRT